MGKYRALVSFTGKLSMARGQVKEINDKDLEQELLRAKFVEEIKEPKAPKTTKSSKSSKAAPKKEANK